jgi:hypothetical protein
MSILDEPFELGARIYPQPVAVSCGRIVRARSPRERLDAILKCSETLTRYLATVGLSSFAARVDPAVPPPASFAQFTGPLSFGHFLTLAEVTAKTGAEHPLRAALVAVFPTKEKKPPATDPSLVRLLQLRNAEGHDLMHLSDAKVAAIFDQQQPDAALSEALRLAGAVLSHPLFLVEQQRVVKKQIIARRLLLMGESPDPFPEEITLNESLADDQVLYLGLGTGALSLHPCLLWDLAPAKANYSLYFLHQAGAAKLKYITVSDDDQERNGVLVGALAARLTGTAVTVEAVRFQDGESFTQEWGRRRQALLPIAEQALPWKDLDTDTVLWFAHKLGAGPDEPAAQQAIRDKLLDGRNRLPPDEMRQLVLLLGRPPVVRQVLGRAILDCRARVSGEGRWDERVEVDTNVLAALRAAIEFFGRHVGAQGLSLDGLHQTSGSADYIALREALVNLFIHQDYTDRRMAAQIEHTPEWTQFFNAGKALVSPAALVNGGKSQSRNPLISRALRLIGFAELAGSGLREVHRVWRQAKRHPPRIESDDAANSFTLVLDWRPLPEDVDPAWIRLIGAKVTPAQAHALRLAAGPAGVSVEEIASALGLLYDDAQALAQYLKTQVLVHETGGRLHLTDHLKAVLAQAQPPPA